MNCRNTTKPRGQRTRWWGKAAALSALFALGLGANAQVATTYTFSQTTGTYSPISGGTLLQAQTSNTTSAATSLDDGTTYSVAIPFTFTFDGTGFTACTVTNNGGVSFGGTAIAANTYTPLSATTAYNGAIAAYGRDMQGGYVFAGTRTLGSAVITAASSTAGVTIGSTISGTGIPAATTVVAFDATTVTMSAAATATSTATACWVWNGEMRTETIGTAPNRVQVIQWSNMKPFGTTLTTVNGYRMNMQVRLYEGTNNVEVVYGDCTPGIGVTSTSTAQVGLRGPNNTFATNVNNRTITKGVTDWATSVVGTTNTSALVFNTVAPANVIPAGLTYRWTAPAPPACSVPSSPTLTPTGGTTADLSWSCASCTGTFVVEYGPAGYTPGTGAAAGATGTLVTVTGTSPQAITGLPATSRTDVYVRQDCGVNGFSANSAVRTFIPGDVCANAIDLSALTSPLSSTTVGAGSDFSNACNTNTDADLVYFIDVPASFTLVIGQTVNGYDSENYVFFGATCPFGTTQIACFDDADIQNITWVNTTGVTQRVWWVQDGFSSGNSGTFTLAWTLTAPPACPAPVSAAATSVTTNSALANWTSGGGSGTFIVEYGPSATFTTPGTGATAGVNGTVITGAVAPQLISGLAGTTSYRYFVRQDCGIDGFSVNSAAQTFTTLTPPPANDDCSNAITIACASTPVSGSTLNSTVDAVYSSCGAGGSNTTERGVWYKIVGDNNQYTITTCDAAPGYDTRLTVYSGSCGTLTCVTANDDMTPACASGSFRSRVQFNAPAGTDYYVFVHGFQTDPGLSATGNFVLNITCAPLCLPVPGNDLCSNAVALTVDAPATAGDNTCSGATPGNPSCESAFATLPDVYYSFVASTGGTNIVTVTLATASDLGYAIYDACGGTQVACVATATSGAPNTHSGLTGGNTYFIRVNTSEAATGSFSIQVTEPCQPAGTRTVVPDCANNRFFIDVNVTSLGTSADIDVTTNFLGDTEPTVSATGVVQIGPYPSGTAVVVTLVHEDGGACNLALSSASFTCPPANDNCANAIAVACNSITAGSTIGANGTDNPGGTCTTSVNTSAGVWYTVQGWGGSMTADLCGSTTEDTKMTVYTGTCGAFTCVAGNDDACGAQSEVTWTSTASTTYYIYVYAFTVGDEYSFNLQVSCGDNNPTCAQNGLTVEFQTDGAPNETTWEIRNAAGTVVASSGGPLVAPFGIQTESGCLPDGCYTLRVLDAGGDGMTTGGYILRTQGTNDRIIDNRNNFSTGSVSAISGGQGFCLPLSADKVIFTSCDKLDWVTGQYVVATPNAAVSAQWLTGLQTDDGYEFWIFDPNGSYSFRRFRNHATSDGFGPASATRACHMKLNNWALASHVPANVLMNVRVRARVNGVNGQFGPACRLAINPTLAACPQTQLLNIPGDPDFSCGATRQWGLGNLVHARPVSGGNLYQFRFRIPAEGFSVTRTASTYFLQLNWITLPLQDGKTYDVDVRVSKNGGATWCSTSDPWGPVCQLTIDNTPAGNGNQNFAGISEEAAELRMYPNPNRGDLLSFSLSAIEEGVNTVTVDIFDLTGARVSARTIAVADGNVNTTVDLNGELAAGMYLVNITAGEKTYTERLVIQP